MLNITREQCASVLINLGKKVDRNWNVALRKERTPSCKINPNGTIHDYGTGFHGDLIDAFIEYGIKKSFSEAKAEAERLLGLEIKVDFSKFEHSVNQLDERHLPDSFMLPHRIDAINNRQAYLAELKQLFLGEYDGKKMLSADWSKILEIAKKCDIGFNKKSGRLIMPIRDVDGAIKTFWKYKKVGEDFLKENGTVIKHRKVLYTKNKPRPPFAILDLIEFSKTPDIPVLITEGEKDSLVANANGLRAICIGGTGASKNIDVKYLNLFKGLNIIICGDYDDAGVEFNLNILKQLKPIAKTVTVLRWEQKAKQDGFKLHEKFDIADYFVWKINKGI